MFNRAFRARDCLAIALIAAIWSLSGTAAAATPNPPAILCEGGVSCTVEASYDLGPLPSYLDDLQWPAPPDEGNVVVIPTTHNGDFSADCTGCEYDANGSTINGNVSFSGSRIRWTGGRINGRIYNSGGTDVLINNVHQVNSTSANTNNYTGIASNGLKQWAIINSTLEQRNGNSGGDWIMFIQHHWPEGNLLDHQNLILANVRLESDAQLVRFQHVNNFVVVDSYFNSNNTAANGMRIHHGTSDLYFRDNIIVGSGVGQSNPGIVRGRFENTTRYNDVSNHWSLPMNDVTDTEIHNSDCHTAGSNQSVVGSPCTLGAATGSNNTFISWDGVSLPSPEEFRASIGKSGPMGANH